MNALFQIHTFPRDSTIHKITFQTPHVALIQSLQKTNLLQCGTSNLKYTEYTFKANTIEPLLQNTMSISTIVSFVKQLAIQLDYLITHHQSTFVGYHPNYIWVIDNHTMVYLGEITHIDANTEHMTISQPFSSRDLFLSPEMLNMTTLPCQVHYKSSYYSLASLIIYLLIYNQDNPHTFDNNPLSYLDKHPIKNTKLYWLLSRCLEEDPNKRSIIFI